MAPGYKVNKDQKATYGSQMDLAYEQLVELLAIFFMFLRGYLTGYYTRMPVQYLVRTDIWIWEYLTAAYYSIFYVITYPVWAIIALANNWHLSMVTYDEKFLEIGLESFQYSFIKDFNQ